MLAWRVKSGRWDLVSIVNSAIMTSIDLAKYNGCLCRSLVGNLRQPMPKGLIFNLIDYIELVDWTGRLIREDKRGAISATAPPILQRLDISSIHWLELTTNFEKRFKGIAGSAQSIKALCAHFGLTRIVNRSNSQMLYG